MIRITLIAAASVCVLLVLTGCGEETPSSPESDHIPVRINERVVVMDERTNVSLHDIGDSWLELAYYGDHGIVTGNILTGTASGGFIRKVISIEEGPDRLLLETEQAYMTDMILCGRTDGTLTPMLQQADAAMGHLDLSGTVLYGADGSPGVVSIESGRIELSPSVEISLSVLASALHEITILMEGDMRIDLALYADLPDPVEYRGEQPVASFRRYAVLMIGNVPIPVQLRQSFTMITEISGLAVDSCRVGYRAIGRLENELEYAGGGWTCSPDPFAQLSDIVFSYGDFSDCNLLVSLQHTAEVIFYSADTALLSLDQWLLLEMETETPPYWQWNMTAGILSGGGFVPGILDHGLEPFGSYPFGQSTVLGSGPFSTEDYLFAGEWLEDGNGGILFEQPRGIAFGPDGLIYVTDYEGHCVKVFDRYGRLQGGWGSHGSSEGMFAFPFGIDVSDAGLVYVADSGNMRVQRFNTAGEFAGILVDEGSWPGDLIQPEGIAAGPDSLVAITDSGSGRVAIFKEDGALVGTWENGLAHGIDFDQDSNLYIAGCPSLGVRKYNLGGSLLAEWIEDGANGPRFDCPIDIAIEGGGDILVAEYGMNRFLRLSPLGETEAVLGSDGSGHGSFDHPYGIAVSNDGWVFIVDTFNRRVQAFAPASP
jgi:DNA-binding beta-propeller fold protein YncE